VLEFVYKGGDNWKRFPAFALAAPAEGFYAGKLIPTQPYAQIDKQPGTSKEMLTK
jgi:hypothetical protein